MLVLVSEIVTDDSHFRVGQEYGRVGRFKDPSQWVVVPVSAPLLPKEWKNLECDAQGYLYGMPDRTGT